jgi:WD40 repeat protein
MVATASLELKVEEQSAHSSVVTSVAFSPDGSTIVSGSYDKTIKVWDAGTLARHIPHPAQR